MKSPFSPDRHSACLEVLEQRIAPAAVIKLYAGLPDTQQYGNSSPQDLDYSMHSYPSHPTYPHFVGAIDGAATQDPIALATGGDANSYYLKLTAGEQLYIFDLSTGFGSSPFVNVTAGTVVLFFEDSNHDGEVGRNEIVGMSMSKNAVVRIGGAVNGDIVANLNDQGTALLSSVALANDGNGLLAKQGLSKLEVGSDVTGKIIAGGNISNITVHGGFGAMLAGSAANGQTYNFFPGIGNTHTIQYAPDAGVAGASISNIYTNTVNGLTSAVDGTLLGIDAGGGGEGALGGSITNVKIGSENIALSIRAGDGGSAGLSKLSGGAGGSISNIFVAGSADLSGSPTPNVLIHLEAGDGGSGMTTGAGGAGGKVSSVHIGYISSGARALQYGVLISDIEIDGGAGGDGKTGGTGGSVSAITTQTITQLHQSLSDPANEFTFNGGVGGKSTVAGGTAGRGGSVSNMFIEDVGVTTDASVLVHAGDGGATQNGHGAAGGSISNITTVSGAAHFLAGNGSSGIGGGAGGSVSKVSVLQEASVFAHITDFSAGYGGDGSAGNGGSGGSVTAITVQNSDLSSATINGGIGGTGGNGGKGIGGFGGAGGGVTAINILDSDNSSVSGVVYKGSFDARGGDGGDGSKGGGKGGSIVNERFVAVDVSATATAGKGGSALSGGNGGAGGSVQKSNFSTLFSSILSPDASVTAGAGGNGLGSKGSGGTGGSITSISVESDHNATLFAGNGGIGDGGAAGKGGSVTASAVFATTGDGVLEAGSAGAGGTKPAAGGNIYGSSSGSLSGVYAAVNLTVRAGDGSAGGAGGSIRYVGYGSTSSSLTPTPVGNILIEAGMGSAYGNVAGVGGSIANVSGSVTSGGTPASPTTTVFRAGDGGGSNATTKTAAGGSISNIVIERGGFDVLNNLLPLGSSILTIEAGDGASSTGVNVGAKGGNVTNVSVSNIGGTLFRSVAAGNGGDAALTGGTGGSITNLAVLGTTFDPTGAPVLTPSPGDIGQRTGAVFGYASMGGIFAGAGGTAANGVGVAGSVSYVNADSIASIVAGRNAAPAEVSSVSHITLNGFNLLHDSLGAFGKPGSATRNTLSFDSTYYSTANFVGAIADITRTNAWQFQYSGPQTGFVLGDTPIDGILLAQKLDQSTINFTPEMEFIGTGPAFDFNNQI